MPVRGLGVHSWHYTRSNCRASILWFYWDEGLSHQVWTEGHVWSRGGQQESKLTVQGRWEAGVLGMGMAGSSSVDEWTSLNYRLIEL